MRKLLLIVFRVCFWIVMLAAIITTVARRAAGYRLRAM